MEKEIPVTKIEMLMNFRENITVNHAKFRNILCVKNAEF
jgi:hypothetical protein